MQIALVGDVMLGRLVNEHLKEAAPAYPWGDTLRLLRGAGVRFANLECVLAQGGTPAAGKVFHFRSDTKNVESLASAAIDVVSLANNHVLDFGLGALQEMLEVLKQNRIVGVGAGPNREAAQRPAVLEVDSTPIAFMAFTDNEPGWEATRTSPGTHYVPLDLADRRAADLLDLVHETKQTVRLLVVSAHWGGNWGSTVPRAHRVFGHALIEAGADVVFGHSAHIFRGIEIYRNRPIIYSAGDFVDDYAVDPDQRNDQSFVFVLEASGNAPRVLRLHPTNIVDFQARLALQGAGKPAGRMQRLCKELGTQSHWIEGDNVLEIRIE